MSATVPVPPVPVFPAAPVSPALPPAPVVDPAVPGPAPAPLSLPVPVVPALPLALPEPLPADPVVLPVPVPPRPVDPLPADPVIMPPVGWQASPSDSDRPAASKPTKSLFDILHLLSWEETGPNPPTSVPGHLPLLREARERGHLSSTSRAIRKNVKAS